MSQYTLLYRGVNQPNLNRRIGRWWSTNPYYALHFAGSKGEMYVAKISKLDLKELAKDVSIEEDFENFFFQVQDPPGARKVIRREIKELLSFATFTETSGPGGTLMKPPADPIAVGKEIFG